MVIDNHSPKSRIWFNKYNYNTSVADLYIVEFRTPGQLEIKQPFCRKSCSKKSKIYIRLR